MPLDTQLSASEFEREHVQIVYDAIAPHFSDTRYKPWPVVDQFLRMLPAGSLVADVGCGNGKYLLVNKTIAVVGVDVTRGLLEAAYTKNVNGGYGEAMVVQGDALHVPMRSEVFDACISIAVIHHFSSPERRLQALCECLRLTRRGGRCLVFVWAFEQEVKSRRKFEEQDVFVSWKMPIDKYAAKSNSQPRNTETKRDPLGNTETDLNDCDSQLKTEKDATFHRFYHVFKHGELEDLVLQTRMATIIESGYDRDNWFVVLERT